MGFSVGHLLVVLLIVVLVFGTKRLGSIGRDLGSALKGFRDAIREPAREDQIARKADERRDAVRPAEGRVDSREG